MLLLRRHPKTNLRFNGSLRNGPDGPVKRYKRAANYGVGSLPNFSGLNNQPYLVMNSNQTTYTVGFAKEHFGDLMANITLETVWRKTVVYALVILSAYVGYQGWQSFGIFGKIVAVIAPFLIVTFTSNLRSFVGIVGCLLFGTLDYAANFTGAYDAYSDLKNDYEMAKLEEETVATPVVIDSPVGRVDAQFDQRVAKSDALYDAQISDLRNQIESNRQSAQALIATAEPLDNDGRTDNDGYVAELRSEANSLKQANVDLQSRIDGLYEAKLVASNNIEIERINAVTQANAKYAETVSTAEATYAVSLVAAKRKVMSEQQKLTPVQKVLTQLPPTFTVGKGKWERTCNTQFIVVGLLALAISFGPSLLNLSFNRRLRVVGHEDVIEMRKMREQFSEIESNSASLEAQLEENSVALAEAESRLSTVDETVDDLEQINAELEAEVKAAKRNLHLLQEQLEDSVDAQQGLLERLSTSSIVHWTPREKIREAHRLAAGKREAVEEFLEVYAYDWDIPSDYDEKTYSKRRDLMLSLVPQVAKHQGELLRGDFATTIV